VVTLSAGAARPPSWWPRGLARALVALTVVGLVVAAVVFVLASVVDPNPLYPEYPDVGSPIGVPARSTWTPCRRAADRRGPDHAASPGAPLAPPRG
jgi:hypothetical protein